MGSINLRRGGRFVALATALAVVTGLLTFVVPAVSAAPAHASTDLSAFDPGLIITDAAFYDTTTMSASDVESFFKSKDPDCVTATSGGTKYTCLADYTETSNSRASGSECSSYSGKSKESAATIVYRVANACHVNPQVLLVTLQKEQGFITGGARSSAIYRKAMGYGCPDSAKCNSKYYGFFNQVYSAAWQFQAYRLNPTHFSFRAGKTNKIAYNPSSKCGTDSVYISNQATAGLYDYTPYVPNSAAIAAGSGSGDSCSSYGNRNFYRYFVSWFGNPANLLKSAGFESGISKWVSGSAGKVDPTVIHSASQAKSGTHFLSVNNRSKPGLAIKQYASKSLVNGGLYTASIWVKSGTPGTPFSGILRAETAGSSTATVDQPFTTTDAWTLVTTQIGVDKSSLSKIELLVILTTVGSDLDLDNGQLYLDSKRQSLGAVALSNSSFESSSTPWSNLGPSGVKSKRVRSGSAPDGKYFFEAKASKTGQAIRQRHSTHTAKPGGNFVFGAWVRSASTSSTPYLGSLRLTTSGGVQESGSTAFSVTHTWQYVTASLDIANAGHIAIVPEFLLTTPGTYLEIDDVSLTPNVVKDGSFEGAAAGVSQTLGTTAVSFPTTASLGIPALDGAVVLEAKPSAGAPSAVALSGTRIMTPNETLTETAWVRSAVPGSPVTASLDLVGTGGTVPIDSFSKSFTSTDEWQKVTVSGAVTSQRTGVHAQLGFSGTSTSGLLVDRVQVH